MGLRRKQVRGSSFLAALVFILLITIQSGDTYMFQNDSASLPSTGTHPRIAVVKPVFTSTAYASFYHFYSKYAGTRKGQFVTSDVGLLDHVLVDGWGWSEGLRNFLSSPAAIDQGVGIGSGLAVLTDVSVHMGELFQHDGSNRFDVVILGFTEYVTSDQYFAYKHFVASGGRLVLMDATNFLAEVHYDPKTNHVSLVKGHSWGFDGTKAGRDVYDRWRVDNINWIGSTFCCSGQHKYNGAVVYGNNTISWKLRHQHGPRVFTSYGAHEENVLANLTNTVVIAKWASTNATGLHDLIAAYIHHYQSGIVVHIGVMSSDIIAYDKSVQSFLVLAAYEPANVNPTN